ncbi:oxamate carbamoyltransferase subunit AllH family protein [Pseudoneobacillus sp. C159]
MTYARSGDVDFIKRIKDSSFSGYIHSTFNRTINLQCFENDELYTIACNQIDNGPNTLVIERERFGDIELAVNTSVITENQKLYIGNQMVISVEKAELWESKLPKYPTNPEIFYKNISKMKEYINLHGKDGGIKKTLKPQSPFDTEMSKIIEERISMLHEALLNKEISDASKSAIRLIGLGPGLTPSGDDYLVGLFTILNISNSPLFCYRTLADLVVHEARTLTNDISYMALKKASVGQTRESIIHLVKSIFTGKDEEFILSLNKVLTIGSTSGTDIALGIYNGLVANMKAGGQV